MLSRTMSGFLSVAAIATLLCIPRAADAVGDNASMRVRRGTMRTSRAGRWLAVTLLLGAGLVSAPVSADPPTNIPPRNIHACNSLRAAFASDPNTTVLLIKVLVPSGLIAPTPPIPIGVIQASVPPQR